MSDLLYIQTISGLLEEAGRTGLREEWIITPVGGAEKVPTFAALIGVQPGMNVATLIDIQKKDHQNIENLYKRKLLKKTHVLTFGDFTGKPDADIEDMFEVDFYLKLVNAEYGSAMVKPLDAPSLKPGTRIVVRVEEAIQLNPASGVKFNHYRPARYFAEHISKLKKGLNDDTINRFEAAFKAVNALL